jgi:hypothetical protein
MPLAARLVIAFLFAQSTFGPAVHASVRPPVKGPQAHPSAAPEGRFPSVGESRVNLFAGWTPTPPILDGGIGEEEWANSATIDISLGATPVILRLMNDDGFLYVAIDNQADTALDPFDQSIVTFDDEGGIPPSLGDGKWTSVNCPTSEGAICYGNRVAGGDPSDGLFAGLIGNYQGCTVVPEPGVIGAYSAGSGHLMHEMRIDLAVSHLHALPGQKFGALLLAYDGAGGGTINGATSSTWTIDDPSSYLTLTLPTMPLDVPRAAAPSPTTFVALRPNPFGTWTELRFALREAGPVRVEVFDVLGQRVVDLVDGTLAAGEHVARWNGRDVSGRPVADGLYLVRMRAPDFEATRKLARIH